MSVNRAGDLLISGEMSGKALTVLKKAIGKSDLSRRRTELEQSTQQVPSPGGRRGQQG